MGNAASRGETRERREGHSNNQQLTPPTDEGDNAAGRQQLTIPDSRSFHFIPTQVQSLDSRFSCGVQIAPLQQNISTPDIPWNIKPHYVRVKCSSSLYGSYLSYEHQTTWGVQLSLSIQSSFNSRGSEHLVNHSFSSNLSGRWSLLSYRSNASTYSASRPWSRVSRRRWHEATLNNQYEAAKTAWPVPFIESFFLPEFKVKKDEESFQVLDVIAKGVYGKVFRAKKKDGDQEFAMKVLSKSKIIMENSVQQVKDEVIIQSMCGHHPFIVHCDSFWQSRKNLFIVTEFVPYGELYKLWHSYGKFPEQLVKIYIAELAFALDFLHNAGVIFRDLKLENILLDGEGHIQVIDFGLAKWLNYGHRTGTVCGTIQYMAPEVLNVQPYTHSVDWWSLGIICYSLLAGHLPVDAVSDHETMRDRMLSCQFRLPEADGPSPGARLIVARLLCKDPLKRLRTIRTLQQEAFFKDFPFDDVYAKKVSPRKVLESCFPEGPPPISDSDLQCLKDDFPWVSSTIGC